MKNVSAAHNTNNGIWVDFSIDTSMMNVSAVHNGRNGICLDGSTDTSMINVSAAHNGWGGIRLVISTDIEMDPLEASNFTVGVEIYYKSRSTSMMNVSAVHNGIWLVSSTNTSMMNVSAAHNHYNAITISYCINTSLYYSYRLHCDILYHNGDEIYITELSAQLQENISHISAERPISHFICPISSVSLQ